SSFLAGPIGCPLGLEDLDDRAAGEATAQRGTGAGRSDDDVVVFEPEVDLVAGLDAERLTQVLGDHDLSFGPHPVSHTAQYNCVDQHARSGPGAGMREDEGMSRCRPRTAVVVAALVAACAGACSGAEGDDASREAS